ncbi:MAG: hypothetical protein WCO12_02650, partial [bacterium]
MKESVSDNMSMFFCFGHKSFFCRHRKMLATPPRNFSSKKNYTPAHKTKNLPFGRFLVLCGQGESNSHPVLGKDV